MMEIWKDIKDYEGLYQVSNLGRIKSLDRYVRCKNNSIAFKKGMLLKMQTDKDGYLIVVLCKNGECKTFKVHRLVAEAFIQNPLNLPQVNHKNEIKDDNRVENLEWCDAKYNINYGTRKQKISEAQKGNTRGSKPVIQIDKHTNEVINEWISASEAQRQLGIQSSNISQCCTNYPGHKSAGGYKWKYKEAN